MPVGHAPPALRAVAHSMSSGTPAGAPEAGLPGTVTPRGSARHRRRSPGTSALAGNLCYSGCQGGFRDGFDGWDVFDGWRADPVAETVR